MCFEQLRVLSPDPSSGSVHAIFQIYRRPVDSRMKILKIFHGPGSGDYRSVVMPNTVEMKIEEVLESIRPALKADGGDVEFLRFNQKDGVVELRLLGACEDCPISMMTLKEGIEQRLKSGIPGITEVQAV